MSCNCREWITSPVYLGYGFGLAQYLIINANSVVCIRPLDIILTRKMVVVGKPWSYQGFEDFTFSILLFLFVMDIYFVARLLCWILIEICVVLNLIPSCVFCCILTESLCWPWYHHVCYVVYWLMRCVNLDTITCVVLYLHTHTHTQIYP